MPLSFQLFPDGSGAFDQSAPDLLPLSAQVNELLDSYYDGHLSETKTQAALKALLAETPGLLEAHLHLGEMAYNQGKPKKALAAVLQGLAEANRLIPESFQGVTEWGHFGNRPYLGLMRMAMMCHHRLRQHKQAAAMARLILQRNPGDNQGVRFLLGSELLRAGDIAQAQQVFQAHAHDYPPYHYELGLSYIMEGNWTAAATALRRAFVGNPYVPAVFSGVPVPLRYSYWHASSFEEPEAALDYLDQYQGLWRENIEGVIFLLWLFNHPKVMVERAAILECREALLWDDRNDRELILKREQKRIAAIDDALSLDLVRPRKLHRGEEMWPWHYRG